MAKQIDFRVARIVEELTKGSLEARRRPSIRAIAESIGIGERNAYKLLSKARRLGFRFGFTVNLHKIGLSVVLGESRIDNSYLTRTYHTVDGRAIYASLVKLDSAREALDSGSHAYTARLLMGSAPALASIPFLRANPPPELTPEELASMAKLLRERLAVEPPPKLWGRKYTVGDETAALMAALLAEDALTPVAKIARKLGMDEMKAQRRIRSLWGRGAIAGYSVQAAPYLPGRGVLVEASHPDPVRLAYSSIILPPVVEAIVARKHGGAEVVVLRVEGGDKTIAQVLRLLSGVGGLVNIIAHYYKVDTG